jgi:hypothetical protein
MQMLNAKA